MKKIVMVLLLLISGIVYGQKVDILDQNRKVIKTVDEKDLNTTLLNMDSKLKPTYVARWIDNKPVECPIKWEYVKPNFIEA